ncbi:putative cyclic phosphodiesterase, U6 snRNA phosphodiesterase Usb1 [Helianthus debilis subsp. tardiflorus]
MIISGTFDYLERNSGSRIRSFPHIEGNYALHVYIPVFIPSERKKELIQFLKKATSLVQGLHVVDIDVPLHMLLKDEEKMVQAALGREFHISLGRTVPIRVHQIDSVVAMLRQKLQFQKRYLIDFNKWEVFVNDDKTRTFLSIENTTGLAEITKQIQAVNEVYKLHNLPEFYKVRVHRDYRFISCQCNVCKRRDPRPHISIAWAVGDISQSLKRVVEGEMKRHINVGGLSMRSMFTCKFSNIVCKVGNKTYNICGSQGQ